MKGEQAISRNQFLALLRERVDVIGTQQRAARLLGISGVYLSDVLRERREPGPTLLKALGYERIVLYQRVRKP